MTKININDDIYEDLIIQLENIQKNICIADERKLFQNKRKKTNKKKADPFILDEMQINARLLAMDDIDSNISFIELKKCLDSDNELGKILGKICISIGSSVLSYDSVKELIPDNLVSKFNIILKSAKKICEVKEEE